MRTRHQKRKERESVISDHGEDRWRFFCLNHDFHTHAKHRKVIASDGSELEVSIQRRLVDFIYFLCQKEKVPILFTSIGCSTFRGRPNDTARRIKRALDEGYQKGTPDLLFFNERHGFSGMHMELKRGKNSYPKADQKQWMCEAKKENKLTVFTRGFHEAAYIIYLYYCGQKQTLIDSVDELSFAHHIQ
jgi:hypothetical protein